MIIIPKKKNIKPIIIDKNKIKKCSKCNESKTLDNFYVHKVKGTIRSACKSCASIASSNKIQMPVIGAPTMTEPMKALQVRI